MNCPGTFTERFYEQWKDRGTLSGRCMVCTNWVPLQTDLTPKSSRLVLAKYEARKP